MATITQIVLIICITIIIVEVIENISMHIKCILESDKDDKREGRE